MYEHGWGVAADREEAIAWYRKAAQRGHNVAMRPARGAARGQVGARRRRPRSRRTPRPPGRCCTGRSSSATRPPCAPRSRRAPIPNAAVGARSLLTDAVERGDLELAEALLQAGADPNAVDAAGDTALVLAAREGRAPLAARLLAAGADARARDALGHTALWFAARGGQLEVVRLLIQKGVDLDAADVQGRTPYDIAARERSRRMRRARCAPPARGFAGPRGTRRPSAWPGCNASGRAAGGGCGGRRGRMPAGARSRWPPGAARPTS